MIHCPSLSSSFFVLFFIRIKTDNLLPFVCAIREFVQKAWTDIERFQEQKDKDLREALISYAIMQISVCKKVGVPGKFSLCALCVCTLIEMPSSLLTCSATCLSFQGIQVWSNAKECFNKMWAALGITLQTQRSFSPGSSAAACTASHLWPKCRTTPPLQFESFLSVWTFRTSGGGRYWCQMDPDIWMCSDQQTLRFFFCSCIIFQN